MNENGSKWARSGLVFGVIASVAGNVSNACLTDSQASIILRVPLAVVWPVALFIGVEVLVRNRAVRGLLARIGQLALLSVTVPTAITSFVNLHALMIKAGEPGMAQLTGPLAIDGLMLGCTVMMLAARVVDMPAVQDMPPLPTPTTEEDWAKIESVATQDITADRAADDQVSRMWKDKMTTPDTLPSWLDGLRDRTDSTTTPAVPVIVGHVQAPRTGQAKRSGQDMAEAQDMIRAWADTDATERPTSSEVQALLSGYYGKDARTIRRWMAATLAA